ncbi:MAG: hypothetical protein ACAI38_00290 [Myxococcota bacterium]|nr:hypothetical protein [Myxococcota bacterium]
MGSVDFEAWCTRRALKQFCKEERARGNDVPDPGGGLLTLMRRPGPERLREPDLPKPPPYALDVDGEERRASAPRALLQRLQESARDPHYAAMFRTVGAFDTPTATAALMWTNVRGKLPDNHHFALTGSGWCLFEPSDHRRWARLRPIEMDDLRGLGLPDIARLLENGVEAMIHENLSTFVTYVPRPPPEPRKPRLFDWLRRGS